MQGSARHNTFIALAVAESVFGVEGLALAALITALLIPVTNISVVALMLIILRGTDGSGIVMAILRDLIRNPLLIAVVLGITVNIAGIDNIPVLYDMAKILGAAALPIVSIGCRCEYSDSCDGRSCDPNLLIHCREDGDLPISHWAMTALAIGLDPLAALIAMIFGAVPSAPSSYTLARQMGGDAPAMAAIVTIQTAISFATLPLTLSLAQYWFVI